MAKFITLEGGDGCGKSTQARLLKAALEAQGHAVLLTREPGGSPAAEDVRTLLVTGEAERWDKVSELLLFLAARRNHVETIIKPALAKGIWVVCDRFIDSTYAYQGYGHGVDLALIDQLHQIAIGDFVPDITLLFDMPIDDAIARTQSRLEGAGEDRFEQLGRRFHEAVRDGFLQRAQADPKRITVCDATQSPEVVHGGVMGVF